MGFHPTHSEFSESQALCNFFHACLLFRCHAGSRQRSTLYRCQRSHQTGEVAEDIFLTNVGFPLDAKRKYNDAYCNDFVK